MALPKGRRRQTERRQVIRRRVPGNRFSATWASFSGCLPGAMGSGTGPSATKEAEKARPGLRTHARAQPGRGDHSGGHLPRPDSGEDRRQGTGPPVDLWSLRGSASHRRTRRPDDGGRVSSTIGCGAGPGRTGWMVSVHVTPCEPHRAGSSASSNLGVGLPLRATDHASAVDRAGAVPRGWTRTGALVRVPCRSHVAVKHGFRPTVPSGHRESLASWRNHTHRTGYCCSGIDLMHVCHTGRDRAPVRRLRAR